MNCRGAKCAAEADHSGTKSTDASQEPICVLVGGPEEEEHFCDGGTKRVESGDSRLKEHTLSDAAHHPAVNTTASIEQGS